MSKKLPQKIVAFGDSTTALRENLVVYADKIACALAAEGIEADVINAGVPGNDTDMAAARFEADVLRHQPDIVIIQFGINDSSIDVWKDPPETEPRVSIGGYRANLERFVADLKAIGASVVLMTPNQQRWSDGLKQYYGRPPFDIEDPKSMTHLLGEYAAAAREVAAEMQVPLVDIYQEYERFENEPGGCESLLLDGSHPNQSGQDLVASCLMQILPAVLRSRCA
jgi:lysophospholipase L1-like esterase